MNLFGIALVITITFLVLALAWVRQGTRPYLPPARHVAATGPEVSEPTDTVNA